MMSWPDRFALIQHYKPTDPQVCSTFGLSQDELDTARSLRDAGTFRASTNLDVAKYANVFTTDGSAPVATVAPTIIKGSGRSSKGATTFTKPESSTKKVKVPQKRGRKGDKIAIALAAVPMTQTPVETFILQHGVSLAVLRQSKRFLAKLDPAIVATIGRINVRQDKATKQLMIWRDNA
jgi:hypothetical protein